jgi:hypothetical protein
LYDYAALIVPTGAAELTVIIKTDIEKWGEVIKGVRGSRSIEGCGAGALVCADVGRGD